MTEKKRVFTGKIATRKKKKSFVSAFEKSACNVSSACKVVGISRNCFYDWMKDDSVFKQAIDEAAEENIDFAETMLMKNIREQKETSIIFYLKTKGKSRGYIETVDNQITINPFEELLKAATSQDDES